ncbi:hypothetical protein DSC47_12245 [Elizabethkingia miricola]|uniref:hypothetical protein n=1 Tax=Elizabethkingia bruuniana TaxID=1756149 RepID=UPI00099971C7|nr:hypothetical protein [Elizabethkingia bruuniana]OPC62260.1 hypothetical protein BAY13_05400 [Elizabethkingia bruuniana]RBI92030.1 hypothetical protein DSC47_12245 [Elizabethkingia miricola]
MMKEKLLMMKSILFNNIKLLVCFVLLYFFTVSYKEYKVLPGKSFEVFNALLYKGVPNLKKEGFNDLFLFYEDDILDKNKSKNNEGGTINLKKIITIAKRSLNNPNTPVCLDIESWQLDDIHREESKKKYLEVLNYFTQINKKSKIGYFGVFPMDSPHADYNYNSPIRETVIMPKWQESNDYMKSVGYKSNVFYPVFYTRTKDRETWKKIVIEKVNKIREVNKTAKIYGFIWPNYYTDNGKYPFIEDDFWEFQLNVLHEYCDGAIIWSHYNGPEGTPINFNYNMGWYKVTQAFIKKIKNK